MKTKILLSCLLSSLIVGCTQGRPKVSKEVQKLAVLSCEFGALSAQQDMMLRDGTASLGKEYTDNKCKELLDLLRKDNDFE